MKMQGVGRIQRDGGSWDRGGTVLFAVRLDGAILASRTGWAADIRRLRQIGDFNGWKDYDRYQQAFARLLRGLRVEQPPTIEPP